ncbi:MAG: replication restart helicase PriA [Solirubrobacteraceae bacterium]
MIAHVEPLTRTRAVRGPFDYRLRPDQSDVDVGSLLRVPFGGRRTVGIVVAMGEHSELEFDRLAEPEAVLPARLPADLVALATWMAREYCSTPARALGLVLAPGVLDGVRPAQVLVAELTHAGRVALRPAMPTKEPRPSATVIEPRPSATVIEPRPSTDAEATSEPRPTRPTTESRGATPGNEFRPGKPLTARQRELLARLELLGPSVAAELGTAGLRRLQARGLLTLSRQVRRRRPARHHVGAASATPPPLTPDQQSVLDQVLAALSARRGPEEEGHFLLHGVTGSGKTEVYLRSVAATLAAGRSAIVLVPEIALTPQVLERFEARFGDVVAVAHSGLGQGERYDEWLALASGEARVCVGARSAVFAPLADIGLIIVDEEHESSYKHDGDPRYDARAVAHRRAQQHGAVLLLGSATPRPESVLSIKRLSLPRRIDGRPLPPVEVLDMRGHHHPLHPTSRNALAEVRRTGGKAIVLLNRRGWSNFLSCRACGRTWMCPNCDVALVLHRAAGFLACHHCGHREAIPHGCGVCGSVAVARHGAGTERVEHELREALGELDFPVFRLDADSASLSARARTLEQFLRAPAGVLVGTQMVAKGHDFPDVALGIVLDADQTLRFPDFRAEERTFALVTQLAGRAGRSGPAGPSASSGSSGSSGSSARSGRPGPHPGAGTPTNGRVLVQTVAPDARPIRFAARHDAEGFLASELERRKALHYPPFGSLIRIVCSSPDAAQAHELAASLRARIAPPGATVLGPAPMFTLRGRARTQLVIKANDRAAAIRAVGAAVDSVSRGPGRGAKRVARAVNVSVDVDPQ